MSDEQEEILTGRAGNEAAQGYEPMPLPATEPEEEPVDISHFQRPEPPAPIERQYQNLETGEARPDNETVELERAADDLKDIRERELKQIDDEARAALSAALDGEQQDHQPEPDIQPQPEADPAYAQPGPDPEVERALQNPKVREAVANQLKQYEVMAEYSKQHYVQAANALIEQVNALAITNFPELAPFVNNPQQMQGALQMLAKENPGRYTELQNFTQRASMATEPAQKVRAEQMQAVQQRATQEFQRYAAAEDAKAFSKTPPEELTQIRNFILQDAQRAGISRELLVREWNSSPALRNSYVSELAADGARYRMAKQGLAAHRNNPVPKVQRPGVASDGPRDDGEYASLERQFRGKSLSLKDAAALINARRARG